MYTIQEVCRKTGLTAHTLRYYEKEGLLPDIGRSAGGFRLYSDEDMDTLGVIRCLKSTGMPLKDISRFMALTREGDSTLRERCEMLKNHRDEVLRRMEEMQHYLDKVDRKYDYFSRKLKEFEEKR